ncbi:MAG: dienelactone hydrolase [Pseudomonadota bacterium]
MPIRPTPRSLAAGLALAAVAAAPLLADGHAMSHSNRIDLTRPDAPALAAPGPHPVGVRTLEFTDPGRLDVLNVADGARPTYDRTLVVEVWHPAAEGTEPGTTYQVILRDGAQTAPIRGAAARDAAPAADGPFPLAVISHGYPGNRHLMAHLGEHLASHGYVAVSIDHRDSTYDDFQAFGSTLVNRPLDQKFVIDSMQAASAGDGPLAGLVDADATAVVGYSMGGYGAVIFGGGGVAQTGIDHAWGAPDGTLAMHKAGSDSHEALVDDRVKALVSIGPWGWNLGFWDAESVAGLRKPTLFVAGDGDDVSGYDPGVRSLWTHGVGADRWLLTFENANHNAAAPMPAPVESWAPVETLDFIPFDHYADAVWDTQRMNDILQHFTLAFLDLHVKGDADKAPFLDLVPVAKDGVAALNEDGTRKPEHTYWEGFAPRTAIGLRLEKLAAGE